MVEMINLNDLSPLYLGNSTKMTRVIWSTMDISGFSQLMAPIFRLGD